MLSGKIEIIKLTYYCQRVGHLLNAHIVLTFSHHSVRYLNRNSVMLSVCAEDVFPFQILNREN